MKDAAQSLLVRPILRLVRRFICCGTHAAMVRPVPLAGQGFAEKHFERGAKYDSCS